LPHWDYPKLIVNGKHDAIDFPKIPKADHYHQFVDACLGNDECIAPITYTGRLTEFILQGVIANRCPIKLCAGMSHRQNLWNPTPTRCCILNTESFKQTFCVKIHGRHFFY